MTIDHHLREKLKALKLSGILNTLDVRVTQTQNGEIGTLEFLHLILQDEIERRAATAAAAPLAMALPLPSTPIPGTSVVKLRTEP